MSAAHELPERTRRALDEQFLVYRVSEDGVFVVRSQSGNWYVVDLRDAYCSCPDHRNRGVICKHQRRCALDDATGKVVDL